LLRDKTKHHLCVYDQYQILQDIAIEKSLNLKAVMCLRLPMFPWSREQSNSHYDIYNGFGGKSGGMAQVGHP
jgi:hypothetical protein